MGCEVSEFFSDLQLPLAYIKGKVYSELTPFAERLESQIRRAIRSSDTQSLKLVKKFNTRVNCIVRKKEASVI